METPNLAYRDTLEHMPEFFSQYDPEFAAHKMPGSIDHPISIPEGRGVSFIWAYLEALRLENKFCESFPPEAIDQAMGRVDPHYDSFLPDCLTVC